MHLVVYGDYRRLVDAPDNSLFQEIETKFDIALQDKRVQCYSPDFEVWCDISANDILPSKSKIRVIDKVQNEGAANKTTSSALEVTCATTVQLPIPSSSKLIASSSPKKAKSSDLYVDEVDNDDYSSDVSSDTFPLMRESSISTENTCSNQSGRNATTSSAAWPLVCSLPSFSEDVQRYVENFEHGDLILPKIRKSIVEALYVDLSKNGMYPGTARYYEVCSALVSKYPQLCDRHPIPGQPNFTMWCEPLKSKFKEARRRMKKTGYLREMQEKYGKSKRQYNKDENGQVCKRRRKIVKEKEEKCLEDESTVAKHKAFIRNEMIKGKPNFVAIKDRMNRTFSARRAAIHDKSVVNLLEQYPALKMAPIVNHEMEKITAMDVLTSVRNINRYSFMRLLQWRTVPAKISGLLDDGQCTTLAAIPSAFNEKWKTFFLIDETANAPYPVLIYKSDTKRFEVHVEGCIISGAQDFLEGLATMLSSYWVFDLNFPKGNKKTFGYIAGTLLSLPGVPIPNAVYTAINHN